MKSVRTTARDGSEHLFFVDQEEIAVANCRGIYYRIYQSNEQRRDWKHFMFKILFIQGNRILIYLLDNQAIPELSSKGIVKAMIYELRNTFQMDVVSSTNIEELKIAKTEGRVSNVTENWKRWMNADSDITYLQDEDRYVLSYSPPDVGDKNGA